MQAVPKQWTHLILCTGGLFGSAKATPKFAPSILSNGAYGRRAIPDGVRQDLLMRSAEFPVPDRHRILGCIR